MPDADPDDPVTTASDGVTVEKSFAPEDFPVPAIAFEIRSTRETAVSVRLVDTVPDDAAPGNVGFHPKYGAAFWDADGDEIVFEREFAPGESYTTVYGLRGDDAASAARFLSEPRLETAAPAAGGDSHPLEADPDPTDGSETRADTGTADDPPTEADNPSKDRSDGSVSPVRSPDRAPERDSGSPHGAAASGPPADAGGDILGALAAELETTAADDPDLAALRTALGTGSPASVEARIEHLQSTVTDLEAYTDALETLLDGGDARGPLADLRDRHDETAERLDDVEATAVDAAETIETTEERLGTDIEAVRSDIRAVRNDVRALEAEVATVSSELESLQETRDRLANALTTAGGDDADPDVDA